MNLHIGCGNNLLNGWINIDILNFFNENYLKINVVNEFPFGEETIDFIFSEHFLEHLDEVDGYNLLKKCFYSLKKEGVLRISIPCLDEIIYNFNNFEEIKKNNEWFCKFDNKDQFLNFVIFGENCSDKKNKFLNGFISTNDGHKFFYSKEDIKNKLLKIGFSRVNFVQKGKSNFKQLSGLETRKQLSDLTLEAIK